MPRQSMFGDAEMQRMKDAYVLGGASLAKIAVDFGVSVPTVSKYLSLAGVEIRPRGRPRKKSIPETTQSVPVEPEVVEAEESTGDVPSPVFSFGE